ncbi:MAG: lipoprotein [Gammaproteobacteria bacterium]|nr:lipoprotein [Gammaproteobacteria bacterium]MCY3988367.1 lipoprotein [Gammaproteobacteria bacterium]
MPCRRTALATFLLALALSGCGFSGALYIPEETPPAPQEQPVPEDEGPAAEAGT